MFSKQNRLQGLLQKLFIGCGVVAMAYSMIAVTGCNDTPNGNHNQASGVIDSEALSNGSIDGELLEKLIGSDESGRPQPVCRLVNGCSGTFVKFKGKLYVATALHCINHRGSYQIEVYLDGKMVQVVTGSVFKLSQADDVALLRVSESQFRVQPRSFELSEESPKGDGIVVVAGAWAGSGIPNWNPGSKNTAIRVLRVGQQVRQWHWELQDAAWPGASGGGILFNGKLIGVMSTTDSRGISTFASVGALALTKGATPNSTISEGQLFLVTKPDCKPCIDQATMLENHKVDFEKIDYRVAQHRGWAITMVPTLVYVEGGVPKAQLVGMTSTNVLDNWLTEYATRMLPSNGCADGVCPAPGGQEKAPNETSGTPVSVWPWILLVIVLVYTIRLRSKQEAN